MAGDILARGGKSATFGPPSVSQEKWDEIWSGEKDPGAMSTIKNADHLHVGKSKTVRIPQE